MTLAEQLQWQRQENERKQKEREAGGGEVNAPRPPKAGADGKPDMSKMSLAEQLQW